MRERQVGTAACHGKAYRDATKGQGRLAWHSMELYAAAWHVIVWHGMARHAVANKMAWHGAAWHGMGMVAMHDMSKQHAQQNPNLPAPRSHCSGSGHPGESWGCILCGQKRAG